ncbi:MAG: isochorismate synthase [Dysgonomonas sp.]|nr:isochorismate synthase [Dysgonomonas sp.]
MDFHQNFDYKIFDSLISSNIHFAIYRFPGGQDIHFILQESTTTETINSFAELGGKLGFVVAPFRITEKTPIDVIRPEIVLKGEKAIFEYLANKKTNIVEEKVTQLTSSNADTKENYSSKFDIFHSALTEGQFQKLVLSRTADYEKGTSFSAGESFKRACEKFPYNFIFLSHTPKTGTWMGISPELLVSEKDGIGKTVALAGTKELSAEWDEKNRREQQIVVDYMQQQLKKADYEFSETEPFTVQSGNINHLKTEFTFDMSNRSRIGELLSLLHPSPAVCGFPKEEAFDFICRNEGYERSYYSGFVGPLGIDGGSDLYVNLRCMQIGQETLRLYAGGGLLPSSDMHLEWNETENKLQTILSVLR